MKQPKQNSKQQRDEKLSALLDNALDNRQLDDFMSDLKRDPVADAETAQRYRLMGDVMRDELDQASFMDISSAVQREIENEPALDQVQPGHKKEFRLDIPALLSAWFKPLTGMAVAASVAMVTLVTFNTVQNNDESGAAVQLAQSQPAQLVNPEIARNVRVASTLDTDKKSSEQQKQLNQYMMQHSGYASQSTMQGIMPYVRAVGVKNHEKDLKVHK